MSTFNPEIRAAEILALIVFDYPDGGWMRGMTSGEILGWEWYERERFAKDSERIPDRFRVPRNQRELAGYLAAEIVGEITSDANGYGWDNIRAMQRKYGVRSD